MKTLTVKMIATGEVKEVVFVSRIDANMFECKSSSKKRKSDMLVHIDQIITDMSDIKAKDAIYTNEPGAYVNTDEFAGLCQAAQIGENPFKATILSR